MLSNNFLTSQINKLTPKMTSSINSIQTLTTQKNILIGQMQALSIEPVNGVTFTVDNLNTLVKNFNTNKMNYLKEKGVFNKYSAHVASLKKSSSTNQLSLFTNINAVLESYLTATTSYGLGDKNWKSSYSLATLISEDIPTN